MSTVYECIGKGGEYLVVATAFGAGTLRHDEATVLIVYKDADGVHYVRTEKDFNERMQEVGGRFCLPVELDGELTNVRCMCGDEYPHDSYGAGFIAGHGKCENCAAYESAWEART